MVKIEYYNGTKLVESIFKPNVALARWYVKNCKESGNYSGTFKIIKE